LYFCTGCARFVVRAHYLHFGDIIQGRRGGDICCKYLQGQGLVWYGAVRVGSNYGHLRAIGFDFARTKNRCAVLMNQT
jgi:hypothetical protein